MSEIRGGCGECVCRQFFGVAQMGAQCGYCGHAASAHRPRACTTAQCGCRSLFAAAEADDCGYCGHAAASHPVPAAAAAPRKAAAAPARESEPPVPAWMLPAKGEAEEDFGGDDELSSSSEEEDGTESTEGDAAEGSGAEKRRRKRGKGAGRRKRGGKGGGMFRFSAKKLAKVVAQEQRKMKENACRVVVVGATGSGKSSLVNRFFGEEVAATGVGKPVTQDFGHYEPTDQRPVHLYDSKGFERQDLELRQRTEVWVRRQQAQEEVCERLHVLWYVIDCGSARWLDADTEFCRDVFADIPVIVVMHKADLQTAYDLAQIAAVIRAQNIPNMYAVVPAVSVTPRRGPDTCPADGCGSRDLLFYMSDRHFECRSCAHRGEAQPYGHEQLLMATMEVLPGAVKQSFRAAQNASMHEKHVACAHVISQSARLSFLSGSIPFPHVDELAMNIVQVRQIVKIALLFGVQPALVVGVGGAAFAAQFIIGQPLGWIKWVPVVGTAAGVAWCMPFYAVTSVVFGLVFAVVIADLAKWTRDYVGDDLPETELASSYMRDIDYRRLARIMFRKLAHERKPNTRFFAQFIETTPVVFKTANGQPSFLSRVRAEREFRSRSAAVPE